MAKDKPPYVAGKTKAGQKITSGGTTVRLKGKQPRRGNKGAKS